MRDPIPEVTSVSPLDVLFDVTRVRFTLWCWGIVFGPVSGSKACPSWRWSPCWVLAAFCRPRRPPRTHRGLPCGWWGEPPPQPPHPQTLLLLGIPDLQSWRNTCWQGKLVERSVAVITIDGIYVIGEELEGLCVVGNLNILESPESGGFWTILKNVTKVSSAFCTGDLRPD